MPQQTNKTPHRNNICLYETKTCHQIKINVIHMNQVCQALSGWEEVFSSPTFHPKKQNTQSFSEITELVPSAPHPFRNQDADKTSNSSDPTLQILYESLEMSILRKTKTLHMEGVWKWKSICKPCTGKILPQGRKLKRSMWRSMSLDRGWTRESFSNLGPRHLEPHWQSGVIVPYFRLSPLGSTISGHLLMQD